MKKVILKRQRKEGGFLALKSQKTKILRLFAAGFPIIPSLQMCLVK